MNLLCFSFKDCHLTIPTMITFIPDGQKLNVGVTSTVKLINSNYILGVWGNDHCVGVQILWVTGSWTLARTP